MHHLKHYEQMSESYLTAACIILSGGFQDAYTYACRGKVFANAQTGNMVLLSANLVSGQWNMVLRYLFPILSYAAGVAVAEIIHEHRHEGRKFHWRQWIILAEFLILFAVAWMPESLNNLANALVSFACAMQVQAFRKVHGHLYASTMCIGNLRSGMDALCNYCHTRQRKYLQLSLTYFFIILIFIVGAGMGYYCATLWGLRGILGSCVLLLGSFLFMFIRSNRNNSGNRVPAQNIAN